MDSLIKVDAFKKELSTKGIIEKEINNEILVGYVKDNGLKQFNLNSEDKVIFDLEGFYKSIRLYGYENKNFIGEIDLEDFEKNIEYRKDKELPVRGKIKYKNATIIRLAFNDFAVDNSFGVRSAYFDTLEKAKNAIDAVEKEKMQGTTKKEDTNNDLYEVEVTEVLSRVVSVKAISQKDANEIVEKMYYDEEIILNEEDVKERNFAAPEKKQISKSR